MKVFIYFRLERHLLLLYNANSGCQVHFLCPISFQSFHNAMQ